MVLVSVAVKPSEPSSTSSLSPGLSSSLGGLHEVVAARLSAFDDDAPVVAEHLDGHRRVGGLGLDVDGVVGRVTKDEIGIGEAQRRLTHHRVAGEVETALEKEERQHRTVLFPIRIDDAVMKARYDWAAKIRRERHITDMSQWKEHDAYQGVLERLLSNTTL